MLKLTQPQQAKIYNHAQITYPEECCGILFGIFSGNQETEVVEVWETENAWESSSEELFSAVTVSEKEKTLSRRERFTIAPTDLLKAQKHARQNNLEIVGIYHSHPDHLTNPSEFDRAIAWETYSYLIISVQQGKVMDCRSWVLDDQHNFQEETIVIL